MTSTLFALVALPLKLSVYCGSNFKDWQVGRLRRLDDERQVMLLENDWAFVKLWVGLLLLRCSVESPIIQHFVVGSA